MGADKDGRELEKAEKGIGANRMYLCMYEIDKE